MLPNVRSLLGTVAMLALVAGCASTGGANFDMTATPLQVAVGQVDASSGFKPRTPDPQKVRALVEAGADLGYVNGWGSALHSAARHGTTEIVEYLLAHGADVNQKDNARHTPLICR